MILSRLTLDPGSRQVQFELANPYRMHCTLMSGLPEGIKGQERMLFRVETSRTPPYLVILVQSHLQPDWSGLEKSGYLAQPAQVKVFDPHFQAGQVLAFRLTANPTKRLMAPKDEDKPGKRIGLFRTEDQEEWLRRKAGENGFVVLGIQAASLGDQFAYKEVQHKVMKMTYHGVRFNGLLQVTDAGRFITALQNGIGSAKGFGYGLLSLARA